MIPDDYFDQLAAHVLPCRDAACLHRPEGHNASCPAHYRAPMADAMRTQAAAERHAKVLLADMQRRSFSFLRANPWKAAVLQAQAQMEAAEVGLGGMMFEIRTPH